METKDQWERRHRIAMRAQRAEPIMTMEQQVSEAVTRALGEHRAEMTQTLFDAIVAEVVKSFTPVTEPFSNNR